MLLAQRGDAQQPPMQTGGRIQGDADQIAEFFAQLRDVCLLAGHAADPGQLRQQAVHAFGNLRKRGGAGLNPRHPHAHFFYQPGRPATARCQPLAGGIALADNMTATNRDAEVMLILLQEVPEGVQIHLQQP